MGWGVGRPIWRATLLAPAQASCFSTAQLYDFARFKFSFTGFESGFRRLHYEARAWVCCTVSFPRVCKWTASGPSAMRRLLASAHLQQNWQVFGALTMYETHHAAKSWSAEPPPAPWSWMQSSIILWTCEVLLLLQNSASARLTQHTTSPFEALRFWWMLSCHGTPACSSQNHHKMIQNHSETRTLLPKRSIVHAVCSVSWRIASNCIIHKHEQYHN